jgi:hypothetical protein
MLKFIKDGKIVGILKDESSEPEGEAFKFRDENQHIKPPSQEKEDESVCGVGEESISSGTEAESKLPKVSNLSE